MGARKVYSPELTPEEELAIERDGWSLERDDAIWAVLRDERSIRRHVQCREVPEEVPATTRLQRTAVGMEAVANGVDSAFRIVDGALTLWDRIQSRRRSKKQSTAEVIELPDPVISLDEHRSRRLHRPSA